MGTLDVEPEVGTVFVAQPLDYEAQRRYELRLVASDGKWENETLVVVEVINRNDEAPVFSQSQYHAAVMEELSQLPVFILQVSGRTLLLLQPWLLPWKRLSGKRGGGGEWAERLLGSAPAWRPSVRTARACADRKLPARAPLGRPLHPASAPPPC